VQPSDHICGYSSVAEALLSASFHVEAMVYCGAPSKACGPCRAKRTRVREHFKLFDRTREERHLYTNTDNLSVTKPSHPVANAGELVENVLATGTYKTWYFATRYVFLHPFLLFSPRWRNRLLSERYLPCEIARALIDALHKTACLSLWALAIEKP